MRPIVPSAAAAAVVSASVATASVTVGSEEDYAALLSKLVDDLIRENYTGEERRDTTDWKTDRSPPAVGSAAHEPAEVPDVGVLATASAKGPADETSSHSATVGVDKLASPTTCPAACPQEMCECAQADGTLSSCSKQIHELCTKSEITFCFEKEEYAPLYEQLYCPNAACLEDGKPYEECRCEYYLDYCELYWDYVDFDSKVQYACAIAKCCQLAEADDDTKKACIEGQTDQWPAEIWMGGNHTKKVGLWPKSKGPRGGEKAQ